MEWRHKDIDFVGKDQRPKLVETGAVGRVQVQNIVGHQNHKYGSSSSS
jgi:hypothetical protein